MPRRTYIDDNFGTYYVEDESDIEFYFQVQKESVWKKCKGCGRRVHLRPEYSFCNSCADMRERGLDTGDY